jgi:FAD/FMN-containing dehydrogenase
MAGQITRRQLLKRAALAGSALTVPFIYRRYAHAAGEIAPVVVEKFRASLKGWLIIPGDKNYDLARRIYTWNASTEKRPALIVKCTNGDDVMRSVDFAHGHNLLTAVRCGGHSLLGLSTCDGGLIVDVSPMKGVGIDNVQGTVQAGAGLLAQELVAALSPRGMAPVLGECPTVGISGLTLGGGLGWLSGKYGAACDNLISATIITADGRTVTATAERNIDLFWAIRGGGGNFGIATSFQYRVHPVSEVLAGGIKFQFPLAREVLRFYRDFMATAPDELQALIYLTEIGERSLNVIVCYSGDVREGEKVVRPLRSFGQPMRDTVQRRQYVETFTMPLYDEFPVGPFNAGRNCYLERLSDEAIDVVLEQFAKAPQPGSALGLDHYMHGAVCRVARDATAFELRAPGALHIWIESDWQDPRRANESTAWVNGSWGALQRFSGERIYANYLSAVGENWVRAAYGSNYARLAEIKKKYDPTNFFRLNVNIKPTV